MRKQSNHIHFELGGILFRLFPFLVSGSSAFAQLQVHYSSENIVLKFDQRIVEGIVKISVANAGSRLVDSITLVNWPNAYQLGNQSPLAEEMLQDQYTRMYFAEPEDVGSASITFVIEDGKESLAVADPLRFEDEKFAVNLAPGALVNFQIAFRYALPNAMFNGYGFTETSIRLSHWLPRVAQNIDSTSRITFNSRNREAWFVPGTYSLKIAVSGPTNLASNLIVEDIGGETIKNYHLSSTKPEYDALLVLERNGIALEVPATSPAVTLHIGQTNPVFKTDASWNRIIDFLKKEIDLAPAEQYHVVFVGNKNGLQSAGNCILLSNWQAQDDIEGELVEELVLIFAREKLGINPAAHPHLVMGLANYYKHLFFKQFYPDKMLLGPLANTFLARFFDVDHYPIAYQNRMLYLYMARQGLDQPLNNYATDFSRFNQEAVVKGKSALWFSYLRSYVGEKNFLRGMHRWSKTCDGSPESLISAMRYYHNSELDWLLGDIYTTNKKLDYKLKKIENCSSIYTATIKNRGDVIVPISVTGFKDGKPVLTEWKDGFAKKKTVQIHLEDYTSVSLDVAGAMPEINQKNNELRARGIFRGLKPLKMQFYTSFENPNRTQIFWVPSVKYNAYDKVLLGAQFTNANLFRKPVEWRISPEFSTGTAQLTGLGSLKFNFTPFAGPFHLVSFALYGRYYHYAPELAYTRFSPTLTLNFRKPYARSEWLHSIRLRGINVDRETPGAETEGEISIFGPMDYRLIDLRWRSEKGNILRPIVMNADMQAGDDLIKLSFEYLQRWRLSKNHLLSFRLFAGATTAKDPYFQFGLSGTTDYLFDYYFIGRSDKTGVWSQQMFQTDGGFKSQTNSFATTLLAVNINVPFYRFVGAFADVGLGSNAAGWDYGLYVEFIPDFFEVYFPIQSSTSVFVDNPDYYKQIRFVLNVELDAIINRLRRGWY